MFAKVREVLKFWKIDRQIAHALRRQLDAVKEHRLYLGKEYITFLNAMEIYMQSNNSDDRGSHLMHVMRKRKKELEAYFGESKNQ